jgi:glycosyltransferase involved in cell wall biosynthesis
VSLVSAADVTLEQTSTATDTWTEKLDARLVDSVLRPYLTDETYEQLLSWERGGTSETASTETSALALSGDYGPDLMAEVVRYSRVAGYLARTEQFDIIHAHDWMTALAGLRAKAASGKPLVYHVHALEFDRSGENINQDVYDLERAGMHGADMVVAVSHYTRNIVVERYGVHPDKVIVVHNAVSQTEGVKAYRAEKTIDDKIVLFLGRITFQKGPDYFVEAAAKVLAKVPEARFVMAGSGDMMPRMMQRVAQLRMGSRFHFTGFLRGATVEKMYAISDLYVMPSVSEPFGISPLEAMAYDVPVILSKQSGVAEVLQNALKVDFWDITEIANKIIAALTYPVLVKEMVRNCREELRAASWDRAAARVADTYRTLVAAHA